MRSRWKILIIASIAILVTVLHYVVNPHAGAIHDLLQRCYYLPVILAGLWFGFRGGIITAAAISIVYFPHAFHGWHGPHSLFFRMSEITMYHVIGGLTGLLSSRIGNALKSERRARQEREAAYDRLREKTEALFTLEEQLRRSERLAALGRLTAGLAHEIRNPLASIQTTLEILRDRRESGGAEPLSDAREQGGSGGDPDFLEILAEETERLNRTLTNFLEFARAEVKRDVTEPQEANLGSVVEKTAELLRSQCRNRNIQLDLDRERLDVAVGVPESQLRQVFLNLFLNAMDAVESEGWIRVARDSDREHEGRIVVTISDSGPGISETIATHIFDPFYTTKPSGTGLGLSIVERILTAHGGGIALDTTSMPSSTFRLEFPVVSVNSSTPA